MKIKFQLLAVLLVLVGGILNAQSFVNGDLEGMVTGYSTVPPSWLVVSYNDVNCQADSGGTSPDLISNIQPDSSFGIIGTPQSGSTFVGGAHGVDALFNKAFQEGIMQELTGFSIGTEYVITFYQAVVKASYNIDTSGSWMVIVDDLIVGITAPTISYEPFNSTSFSWESRSVAFIASMTSHTIKFLPLDDDNNIWSSTSNINGGLYMGIDAIGIQKVFSTGILQIKNLSDITVYPNPTTSNLAIDLGFEIQHGEMAVYNSSGMNVIKQNITNLQSIDFSVYPDGIYYLQIITDFGVINKSILKY
jgi:hypothetical protein